METLENFSQVDLEELLILMESAETLAARKLTVDKRSILNALNINEDWDIVLEHLREACPIEDFDED